MRITFIFNDIRLCGGYRAAFEISNRLIERGHSVNVVYPFIPMDGYHYPLKKFALDFLSHLKKMNRVSWLEVKARLIPVLTLHPGLVHLFERSIPEADFIIATAWQTAQPVARLSASKGKKLYFVQHYEAWPIWNSDACWDKAIASCKNDTDPSLFFPHLLPDDEALRSYKNIVDATYQLPLTKITTSKWLRELLQEGLNVPATALVPIGNNFDMFSKRSTETSMKLRVLASYRQSRWKGDEDVIQALAEVWRHHPNVEIVLFGGKNKPEALSFPVEYHPMPDDTELRRIYNSCDIFLCASWVEGWGSPPMEAMACEMACVCTAVGAVPEFSEDGVSAMHVPPRSPDKLAAAVIYLIENEAARRQIARAGFERIQSYTWDKSVDIFEGSLAKL